MIPRENNPNNLQGRRKRRKVIVIISGAFIGLSGTPAELPPRNDRDEDRAKNEGDQLRSVARSAKMIGGVFVYRANSQEIVDPPLRSARNNVATPRHDPRPRLERVPRGFVSNFEKEKKIFFEK